MPSGPTAKLPIRTCERDGCENQFEPLRSDNRFCREKSCKDARQKVRWDAWQARQEEAGTLRDTLNKYQQNYRSRTNYARDYELRKKYNITLQDWLAMLERAGNKCELCGKNDENLCVDHDHETGRIRGVLCRRCNRALGQLGDTVEVIQKVLAYLTRTS